MDRWKIVQFDLIDTQETCFSSEFAKYSNKINLKKSLGVIEDLKNWQIYKENTWDMNPVLILSGGVDLKCVSAVETFQSSKGFSRNIFLVRLIWRKNELVTGLLIISPFRVCARAKNYSIRSNFDDISFRWLLAVICKKFASLQNGDWDKFTLILPRENFPLCMKYLLVICNTWLLTSCHITVRWKFVK